MKKLINEMLMHFLRNTKNKQRGAQEKIAKIGGT